MKERSSITLADLFFALFVAMKLAGLIDWSWWWVWSPIWISTIIYFIVHVL